MSDKVQRYTTEGAMLRETKRGLVADATDDVFVQYSDYAALEQERDALRYRYSLAISAVHDLYRRAVNKIDDRIEYSAFTKADIYKIIDNLTLELSAIGGAQS